MKYEDLNAAQKVLFSNVFYDIVTIYEDESPNPWGCPWFWCNDEFSFAKMDHCISTLVDHFIDKYKEEIKQYCHSIVGEQ